MRDSFSYEWKKFKDIFPVKDDVKAWISPINVSGRSVLDAGCGIGRFSYYMEKEARELVALDRNIEEAKEMLTKAGVVKGDIFNIPFNKKFDVVICIGVLQHTGSPLEGIKRLKAHLNPGGQMLVWVYCKESLLYRAIDLIRRCVNRMPFDFIYNLSGALSVIPFNGYERRFRHFLLFDLFAPEIAECYSKEEVESWAWKAGLKITSLQRQSIGWKIVMEE